MYLSVAALNPLVWEKAGYQSTNQCSEQFFSLKLPHSHSFLLFVVG